MAIVVFTATVMWGAYTSLTTPPESLPDDVRELVFDHEPAIVMDDQSFQTGLSDALPELDINIGQPAAPPEPAQLAAGEPESVPASASAVTARLSDAAPAPPAKPHVSTPYASTSQSFELPDPNSVAADFPASGKDLNLPKIDSDFALTSGTANASPLPGNELSSDVIQAAATPNIGVENAIRTADRQYAADQRKEALATLSIFYNTPNLSGQQRADLLARLDPLAREVIYSDQHLLERPYRVGQKETLVQIATKYQVPWQLLANINQIADPMTLLPGTVLKVVTGPFRAEVSLTQQELTLFVGDLYAGRFPIAVGSDPVPKPGTYTVQDKQTEHTFYNRDGVPIEAGRAENPYGSVWLDLGGQLCIHGSPNPHQPTDKGCISLADSFATDLYGILTPGSAVTIRR
jgi:lipoprotein-anchoring transpeptidase ErfK/SrfK